MKKPRLVFNRDCSIRRCEGDAVVLTQESLHTFAWVCDKHHTYWNTRKMWTTPNNLSKKERDEHHMRHAY